MNRFKELTPQVEIYLQKKMNQFESGKMPLMADKIQLFQDLYDTGLHCKLSESGKKFLEILIEEELVKTIRPMELN